MLSNYQRKVLRILYNYNSGRRRLPMVHELTFKTGKARSMSWQLLMRCIYIVTINRARPT